MFSIFSSLVATNNSGCDLNVLVNTNGLVGHVEFVSTILYHSKQFNLIANKSYFKPKQAIDGMLCSAHVFILNLAFEYVL